MVNLIEQLKDEVGDVLVKGASSLLNEAEHGIEKALHGAIPSLMGVFADKASSERGADELMNLIGSNNYDGGLLDNLGDILGAGATNNSMLDNILNQGGNILGSLLGDRKLSGLTDILFNHSGVKKSSIGYLLKLAAPLILSQVGRYIKKHGLNLSGLMDLFGKQTPYIKSALPGGLSGIGRTLGLGGPLSDLGDAAEEVAERATATAKRSTNWLPYLLLALLAVLAIWWFTRGSGEQVVEEAAEKTEELAEDAAQATKEIASDIGEAADHLGDRMRNWLRTGNGDGIFVFRHATFEEGSYEISPELSREIDHLAEVMKDHPKMTVEIAGHTDNTGDPADNKELSMLRAQTIKARLAEKGVAKNRIEAKGYGEEVPVASNNTEEGREKNRRVEVRVLNS